MAFNKGAKSGVFGQQPNKYEQETILSRCIQEPNSGCWIWTESTNQWGYGKLAIMGKHWIAHRASYKIFVGDIPKCKMILHSCDNRLCVNPNHLSIGDHKKNMADMVNRGRVACGEKNGARKHPDKIKRGSGCTHSKLSENDVFKIKSLLNARVSQPQIAELFRVSSNTISAINVGTIWKHVKSPEVGQTF